METSAFEYYIAQDMFIQYIAAHANIKATPYVPTFANVKTYVFGPTVYVSFTVKFDVTYDRNIFFFTLWFNSSLK